MSLIAGGGASASIMADEDNTTVYMFDADYLRAAVHEEVLHELVQRHTPIVRASATAYLIQREREQEREQVRERKSE